MDGYEIDSNESKTTAPKPSYNNHYWWGDHQSFGNGQFNIETDNNNATLDEFTMGIEWLPGKVIYYANGKEVGRSEVLEVYGPSYLWLTAVATPSWESSIDDSKMDANGYFGSSTYEYVSYSQKKLKGVNLLGNGHFEYNRTTLSAKPRTFDSENAIVIPSATAHDGLCFAKLTENGKMEQQLHYLVAGKYGFEGYFRSENGTNAKIVIKDKRGNILNEQTIPNSLTWTKISIPDITVTDSAFVSIECNNGVLLADDVSFYCQEGDDSYASYTDDDYKNYKLYTGSNGTEYSASSAQRNGTWGTSTLNSVNNLWVQVYTAADKMKPLYTNTYAIWNIPVTEDGAYTIDLYRMQYINNVHSQDYSIAVDGNEVDKITVDTQNDTPDYRWVTLKTVYARAGQTITVKMTPCAPQGDAVCARITPIRILTQEQSLLQNCFIAQLDRQVI